MHLTKTCCTFTRPQSAVEAKASSERAKLWGSSMSEDKGVEPQSEEIRLEVGEDTEAKEQLKCKYTQLLHFL